MGCCLRASGATKGRFNGDARYITWSGGFSWAIPRGAKHAELAWKFIKWMNSPESGLVAAAAQKKYNLSKGRPFVPTMHANQRYNDAVFQAFAPKTPKFRNSLRFALSMMPYSMYRPVTVRRPAALGRACARVRYGDTPLADALHS